MDAVAPLLIRSIVAMQGIGRSLHRSGSRNGGLEVVEAVLQFAQAVANENLDDCDLPPPRPEQVRVHSVDVFFSGFGILRHNLESPSALVQVAKATSPRLFRSALGMMPMCWQGQHSDDGCCSSLTVPGLQVVPGEKFIVQAQQSAAEAAAAAEAVAAAHAAAEAAQEAAAAEKAAAVKAAKAEKAERQAAAKVRALVELTLPGVDRKPSVSICCVRAGG